MTEAWLLFHEPAIRSAAGNPRGKVRLDLPRIGGAEDVADPKQTLHELLVQASELTGGRKKAFDLRLAVRRITDFIDDFRPLLVLSAFRSLDEDVCRTLKDARFRE